MKLKNKFIFLITILLPSCINTYSIEEQILSVKDFDANPQSVKNKIFKIEPKTIINLDDAKISYYGNWTSDNDINSTHTFIRKTQSNLNNEELKKYKISYTFLGDTIEFLATKDKDQGMVDIYLDKEFKGKYDLYSQEKQNRKLIFSNKSLEIKEHTLEIFPSGDKNASSSGYGINIDTLFNNWRKADLRNPKVDFFKNGEFLVSWTNRDILYTQVFYPDGTKKTEPLKHEYTEENKNDNSKYQVKNFVLINSSDEVLIFWLDLTNKDPNLNTLYINKLDSNLNRILRNRNSIPIDGDNKYYDTNYSFKRISSNKILSFHCKDDNNINNSKKFYINLFDDNLNLIKKDIKLTSSETFDLCSSSTNIALNKDNGFILYWIDNYIDFFGYKNPSRLNTLYSIYARSFDKDMNPLGKEFQLTQLVSSSKVSPRISINNLGNFVVTWSSEALIWNGYLGKGGFYKDIYARIFDKNGNAITNDFLVNSTTLNDQYSSEVVIKDDGKVLFSWISEFKENYSIERKPDIFGQYFNLNGNKIGNEFTFGNNLEKIGRTNNILKTYNNKVYSFWQEEKISILTKLPDIEDSAEIYFTILD